MKANLARPEFLKAKAKIIVLFQRMNGLVINALLINPVRKIV